MERPSSARTLPPKMPGGYYYFEIGAGGHTGMRCSGRERDNVVYGPVRWIRPIVLLGRAPKKLGQEIVDARRRRRFKSTT